MKRSWTVSCAGALVVVAGLVGCGGDTTTDASPTPDATISPSTDTSAPTGDDQLDNPQGAIAELADLRCEADEDGVWFATATINNTDDEAAEYRFKVAITESETARVLGEQETIIEVDGDSSADVELDEIYEGDDDGLLCVPRLVKGDV